MRSLCQISLAWGAAAVAVAAAGGGAVKVAPPPPPLKRAAPVPPPGASLPPDARCPALPAVRPPFAFSPGEMLEYDLDALGMGAGKLRVAVAPLEDGALPILVEATTNTLFSKIRRVVGGTRSDLDPRTLRPLRYLEEATEDGVHKKARVRFHPQERAADLEWTWGTRSGHWSLRHGPEGLDAAGAIFLLRALPWKTGARTCFDVYSIRRIWRVVGQVEAREHVSLPLGEFEAWHLSGVAILADDPRRRRELHLWVSDDRRRLPLVAVGTIDLGAVRATLTAVTRAGEKSARAQDPVRTLKW